MPTRSHPPAPLPTMSRPPVLWSTRSRPHRRREEVASSLTRFHLQRCQQEVTPPVARRTLHLLNHKREAVLLPIKYLAKHQKEEAVLLPIKYPANQQNDEEVFWPTLPQLRKGTIRQSSLTQLPLKQRRLAAMWLTRSPQRPPKGEAASLLTLLHMEEGKTQAPQPIPFHQRHKRRAALLLTRCPLNQRGAVSLPILRRLTREKTRAVCPTQSPPLKQSSQTVLSLRVQWLKRQETSQAAPHKAWTAQEVLSPMRLLKTSAASQAASVSHLQQRKTVLLHATRSSLLLIVNQVKLHQKLK